MSDSAVTVRFDGDAYTLDIPSCTGRDAAVCRQQTGMRLVEVVNAVLNGAGDLDVIAAVIFMARHKRGDKVTFLEVAESLSYADIESGRLEPSGADEDDVEDEADLAGEA